jgi:MYXO-CTERM domain-containing protein
MNRRNFRLPRAPGLALSFALGTLAAIGGGACQGDEEVFDPGDGTLQGELATYIADDFEQGVQTTKYAIRSASGQERWLDFDRDPGIEPGARIKVWGTRLEDRMQVSSFAQLAPSLPTERITSALKNGTKFPAKRLAFVIIDIGMGSNITPENALKEIVGPSTNADPPLRNYYAEASYGTEELDGQVFGPFSYSIGSCNTSGMPTMFRAMVDQMGGGAFNHYLWYIGSRTSSCSWSGLGEVGRPDRPANDTWYNGSSSCVVMIQEPGHNFGMQHSSSMDCGSVPFHDTPDGNCTHSEYGDRYDPMGGGCRHMNAWQKTYNGWLQGCNMVRVRSSGTYTLVPLELGCDGAQVLQIPAPKTRTFMRSGGGGSATNDMLTHYYLELRTKTGIDASLTTTNPVAAPAVHVRISGDIRGRADRGLHTWILDMDPATSNFDGLGVGKTFEDPAGGVSFTITELDATHATVNVTMTANGGGPVCMDGTTAFTPPGPGVESCNAGISTPGGGIGGAGGTTPTGGTTGAGGRGGTTGAAGRGGTTGSAGTTGMAGRGGTTGAAGNVPIGGSNGAGGTTPAAGTNGTGGTAPTGEAGTTGAGQGGAAPTGAAGTTGIKPNPVTGGCACDVGEGSPSPMLMLALAFGLRVARRYRRSSRPESD